MAKNIYLIYLNHTALKKTLLIPKLQPVGLCMNAPAQPSWSSSHQLCTKKQAAQKQRK